MASSKLLRADLSLSSNFSKRSISISDSQFFSATAESSATPGEYDVEVVSLAQGSFHESQVFTGGSTTTFGEGTLTFTVGAESFNISVLATDNLQQIRDKINDSSDNDLVSVNLLNNVTSGPDTGSVLTFNSSTLGTGNDLIVSYTGDASLADISTGLTSTQSAGDASIKVDGFSATSSNNKFTDVIQDVTIDVSKIQTTPGTTEKLTVALDTASTRSLITTFVDTFNSFVDVTKQLGSADEDSPGLLLGDFTLRQASSQIRDLFSSKISNVTGSFNSLSSIGISTKQDGHLEINSSVLDGAIESDFEQFDELFSGTGGFATQLRDLISNYTGSSGVITSRENSLKSELSRIANDRVALDLKIEKLQLRLTSQFATMDAIVAQMNSTQSFVKQQFESLPGFSSGKNS